MSCHSQKHLPSQEVRDSTGTYLQATATFCPSLGTQNPPFSKNYVESFRHTLRLPQVSGGDVTDFQDDKGLFSNGPDPLAYASE